MRRAPEWMLRNRGWILSGIGLLTILFGSMAAQVPLDRNPEEMLFQGDPDYPLLKEFFQTFGYDEIVVAAYSARDVLRPEHLRAIARITGRLETLEGVDRVLSLTNAVDVFSTADGSLELRPLLPRDAAGRSEDLESLYRRIVENPHYRDLLISRDRTSTLLDITLESGLNMDEREELLRDIERVFAENTEGRRFLLSGAPLGRQEMYRCVQRDMVTLFPLSLLLLVAVMFFFFRRLSWAVLPLAIVSLCVLWAVGAMSLLGYPFNLLSAIVPTVLLIIGTSDCIHIQNRFEDGLRAGRSRQAAAAETVRAMALPCLLTTLTTMGGFLALLTSPLASIRQFGTASAVGIGFAYALSMLLLPLGLCFLRQGAPALDAAHAGRRLQGLLERLFRLAAGRPRSVVAASAGLMLLGGLGLSGLRVETDLPNFFSEDSRGVADARQIEETFGGILPVHVILDTHRPDGLKDTAVLRAVDRLCAFLRTQDGVDKVLSVTDLLKLANRRIHGDDPAFERLPDTRAETAQLLLLLEMSDTGAWLSRFCDAPCRLASVAVRTRRHDFYSIRTLAEKASGYLDRELAALPGVSHHVTGTSVLCANTLLPLAGGLRGSLFLALAVIFVLLAVQFRSVPLGIVSMVPNILPIVMTLGTMGLAGVSLNVVNTPVAAVALGLAVDDTIHFLARFQKEFRRDGRYPEAIRRTLARTGKPILVTSLVLAAGFGMLLFSDFHPTRSFGVLVSLTVLYAVAADLVLLPALLLVFRPLGRRAALPSREEGEPQIARCRSWSTGSAMDSRARSARRSTPWI